MKIPFKKDFKTENPTLSDKNQSESRNKNDNFVGWYFQGDIIATNKRILDEFWNVFNFNSESQSDEMIAMRGRLLKYKDFIHSEMGEKLI